MLPLAPIPMPLPLEFMLPLVFINMPMPLPLAFMAPDASQRQKRGASARSKACRKRSACVSHARWAALAGEVCA